MPGASRQDGIAEVILTAQKIAQPASKTPLALSVLSGEDLKNAGTVDPRAWAESLPGVEIAQESGMLQVSIRVTSLDMTEKGDPSAAFHVDGAYVPRHEAQAAAFFDLDRIEVLRGPQGTLYGRNAAAGAINLITNKPTRKLEGKAGMELGNYGTRRYDAVLNVPLGETWAMRAPTPPSASVTRAGGGASARCRGHASLPRELVAHGRQAVRAGRGGQAARPPDIGRRQVLAPPSTTLRPNACRRTARLAARPCTSASSRCSPRVSRWRARTASGSRVRIRAEVWVSTRAWTIRPTPAPASRTGWPKRCAAAPHFNL